jgi:hypothetical protein
MKCGTKKMAYGGMTTPMSPMQTKKPMAMMAKGGAVVQTANCGASMKPQQKRKK